MKSIAITLRQETGKHGEVWDCIDRRWFHFLARMDLVPLLVPNDRLQVKRLLASQRVDGIILTGGGDLSVVSGKEEAEREKVEKILLDYSLTKNIPLVGICRGMQVIQTFYELPIKAVEGHVATRVEIQWADQVEQVNSYHSWGTTETSPELEVMARSQDGVIKCIRHRSKPIYGMMWHPERESPSSLSDIERFQVYFKCAPSS